MHSRISFSLFWKFFAVSNHLHDTYAHISFFCHSSKSSSCLPLLLFSFTLLFQSLPFNNVRNVIILMHGFMLLLKSDDFMIINAANVCVRIQCLQKEIRACSGTSKNCQRSWDVKLYGFGVLDASTSSISYKKKKIALWLISVNTMACGTYILIYYIGLQILALRHCRHTLEYCWIL